MAHNPKLAPHRQIGYVRGGDIKSVVEEKPVVKSLNQPKEVKSVVKTSSPAKESDSSELYKWLKSHPLINLNGLCQKVGIDRANFIKGSKVNKILSDSVMNKFKSVLKSYGFNN